MEIICNGGFYSQLLRNISKEINEVAGFDITDQTQRLSQFSLEIIRGKHGKLSFDELDQSISAVYSNLINRGLPTLPSLLVERYIVEIVQKDFFITESVNNGAFEFNWSEQNQDRKQQKEWLSALIQSHFPIDPRILYNEFPSNCYDSDAEAIFHTSFLPEHFSRFLPFLVQPQRRMETMLSGHILEEFINQRVDFTVELGRKKLVFEVDGLQHSADLRQNAQDQRRDKALKTASWDVFRLPAHQIENNNKSLDLIEMNQVIQNNPVFHYFKSSFEKPLWNDRLGQSALTIVLAPFGVARIQRTLIQALQNGALSFNMPVWKIVVFERDIRCARLALVDFMEHLNAFWGLLGKTQPLPSVELTIFYTPEFSDYPIKLFTDGKDNFEIFVTEKPFSDFEVASTPGDLFIDLSMMIYQGYSIPEISFYDSQIKPNGTICIIRNAFYFRENRQVHPILPFAYNTATKQNPAFDQALLFFLQNLFRKKEFMDGQDKIIARALALQPVIGLLPTGAGKSICYQLSGFLQPGITLVIDPLNSLMLDQVDNLKNYYAIDWIGFINSSQTASERKSIIQRMANGELLFIFISPERLQNKEFRLKLTEMSASQAVSYAVIDEAHCVSEWGHDFRTSYLRMAATVHDYCCFQGKHPTIIALTGTASFAVLSDVQREIGVEDEKAKVYPNSFDRKNLHFEIINVETKNKYQALQQIIKGLPKKFNSQKNEFFAPSGDNSKAGIVFTPHVNGEFGAYKIYQSLLSEINNPVHYFSGEVPKITIKNENGTRTKQPIKTEKEFQDYKICVQRKFKNNEFNILVATKAFGMGIDKRNIGYVIHYNIPHSLEAYYQEAGRAGRDKKDAYCYIIYSDDRAVEANNALSSTASTATLQLAVDSKGGDIRNVSMIWDN